LPFSKDLSEATSRIRTCTSKSGGNLDDCLESVEEKAKYQDDGVK
jgi:hypothetical protein